MKQERLLLAPAAMAIALLSLVFNVASASTTAGDTGPDLDGGGVDTGPFDSGMFDGPPMDSGSCTNDFGLVCSSSGNPGCAGGGGAGGTGGQGGAASVGLLAIGTTSVSMTNGAFVIGHGGTGGPGGAGQGGGNGEAGAPGQSATCYTGLCPSCTPSSPITGGVGGSGGSGGAGGQGGGGAGGPAYFYVTLGGATVDASAATLGSSVTGTPGVGGQPNGPDGSAGVHP